MLKITLLDKLSGDNRALAALLIKTTAEALHKATKVCSKEIMVLGKAYKQSILGYYFPKSWNDQLSHLTTK